VWVVIVALIVILAIGAAVGSKSSKVSAITAGMRAVIVPSADAARTVVVPPCGTGANVISANPRLPGTHLARSRSSCPRDWGGASS